jgi:hypothetical protein
MAKEPDILPEDHEEWECEYFARSSTEGLVGCLSFLAVLIISFGYFIYSLIF